MSATAVRSDWVGHVIDGRFPLLEWLGGSSRSGVFVTELPGEPGQKAGIKLIPSDTEAEDRLAGWTAAAGLAHPHLVRVLHTGHCEIDGHLLIYAVTEYADEVLSEILPMRALAPQEVKELLGPVLDALTYIHAQGFVHGRLKPSNILAINDVLKVSADSLVRQGSPSGYGPELTPYDAPERDRGELLPASDVWSLGVTIVMAIAERLPEWDRWYDSAPVVPDSIPEPFARVVRGCLEPDLARRFTLAEVSRRLGPSAPAPERPAEPVAAQPDTPDPEMPVPEPGRHTAFAPASEPARGSESSVSGSSWSESSPSEFSLSESSLSGSNTFPKFRWDVLIATAVVLVAAIALLWLHSHGKTPSRSATAEQSQDSGAAPASQEKPPAGIAVPQKSATPHTASSSAPPPETPAPVNPAAGAPVVKGEIAQRVMPDVLPAASRSIQGTVRVQVRVNVGSAGNVSNASFDSAGPSRYFARIAMQAAQQWKFKPAQVNGQPAPSLWILQFRFTRDRTEVSPTEANP